MFLIHSLPSLKWTFVILSNENNQVNKTKDESHLYLEVLSQLKLICLKS